MEVINDLVNNPAQQEVNIIRIFDAPRELVFKLWTNPEYVEKWWGPKDFTNPVCKMNVNVGGAIRIVMQAPDGIQYPTHGFFKEIITPERLVFTSIKEDDHGKAQLEMLNTVIFEEEDGKTKMIMKAVVVKSTPEACGSVDGMNTGWNQSIDRLSEIIKRIKTQ